MQETDRVYAIRRYPLSRRGPLLVVTSQPAPSVPSRLDYCNAVLGGGAPRSRRPRGAAVCSAAALRHHVSPAAL